MEAGERVSRAFCVHSIRAVCLLMVRHEMLRQTVVYSQPEVVFDLLTVKSRCSQTINSWFLILIRK